jgi:3-methyl-2-oxobutanoate hydroxymethyltransferase
MRTGFSESAYRVEVFLAIMKRKLDYLQAKKRNLDPITMITAYDFPMARLADEAGIDAVLVGDSVGTNVLGYASEREVTVADMVHHTAAAARGIKNAFLLADLPFQSAESPSDAEINARCLLGAGAEAVKIEGGAEKGEIIACLANKGISVCAHIGYNPQLHGMKPRVFGATVDEARLLVASARKLEAAGAGLIVLEKVCEEVAGIISQMLRIPTIGIGSGRLCDGQVLVMHDVLGMSGKTFRHARSFINLRELTLGAIKAYRSAVETRGFPGEKNVHHMNPEVFARLQIS